MEQKAHMNLEPKAQIVCKIYHISQEQTSYNFGSAVASRYSHLQPDFEATKHARNAKKVRQKKPAQTSGFMMMEKHIMT